MLPFFGKCRDRTRRHRRTGSGGPAASARAVREVTTAAEKQPGLEVVLAGAGQPQIVPTEPIDAVGWNPGGHDSGDSSSPAAPRCTRVGRAANKRGEASCGNSRPGRRSGESSARATSAAGRRRMGPSHLPDTPAAGSTPGTAHHTVARHRIPGRSRPGRSGTLQSRRGVSCRLFSHNGARRTAVRWTRCPGNHCSDQSPCSSSRNNCTLD
jgi:hypothetical protein